MSLKIKLAGVNEFLAITYGRDSRPSALLEELGCAPEHVLLLRTRHLEAFVDGFVWYIGERLAQYDDGERKFRVLSRRMGLDGEQRATLATLGAELGVSRERVRQIEASTLRRCGFMKQRRCWLEALYTCAVDLLVSEGYSLPAFDPERATQIIERTMPPPPAPSASSIPTERDEPEVEQAPEVSPETVHRLRGIMEALFAAAGDDIADSILADLLRSSTRTVIVALVAHYSLQFAHGAFIDIDRKRLKDLIRDERRALRRAAPMARDAGAVYVVADEHELEQVAQLMAEIRACIGYDVSYSMCRHILHGSHGPNVDALVTAYMPPHYGRLRPLGIKRVMELVKGAHARLTATGVSAVKQSYSDQVRDVPAAYNSTRTTTSAS